LIPIITAFVYLLGLTPQGIDPVPMVLWASLLLYLGSIHSSRLFKVMPVAKDAIFHSINDGVIVLDESFRLIEFNQACNKMFPPLTRSMFGLDFTKIWIDVTEQSIPFTLETIVKTQEFELDLTNRTYQVRISPLQHVNHGSGLLLIFTDITEVKKLQRMLEKQAFYDELTQSIIDVRFFNNVIKHMLRQKEPQSHLLWC